VSNELPTPRQVADSEMPAGPLRFLRHLSASQKVHCRGDTFPAPKTLLSVGMINIKTYESDLLNVEFIKCQNKIDIGLIRKNLNEQSRQHLNYSPRIKFK
jgi:hypothetical protein